MFLGFTFQRKGSFHFKYVFLYFQACCLLATDSTKCGHVWTRITNKQYTFISKSFCCRLFLGKADCAVWKTYKPAQKVILHLIWSHFKTFVISKLYMKMWRQCSSYWNVLFLSHCPLQQLSLLVRRIISTPFSMTYGN